jgi:hypothetical protein
MNQSRRRSPVPGNSPQLDPGGAVDMNIDEAALRKRGSPLVSLFDRVEPGQKSLQKPGEKILKNC